MERGSRFQGGYGTGEYFGSGESEVYPFKKISYRESEQQQGQLRSDLSSQFGESFIGAENISTTIGETIQQQTRISAYKSGI